MLMNHREVIWEHTPVHSFYRNQMCTMCLVQILSKELEHFCKAGRNGSSSMAKPVSKEIKIVPIRGSLFTRHDAEYKILHIILSPFSVWSCYPIISKGKVLFISTDTQGECLL